MRVFEYPAGTVEGEPIVTDELLAAQQREIDASLKRTEHNAKRVSVDLLSVNKISIAFIVILFVGLFAYYGLLLSSAQYNMEKDMTDAVTQRIVNEVQQGVQ